MVEKIAKSIHIREYVVEEWGFVPMYKDVGYKEFCIGNIYNGVDEKKRSNLMEYSDKENVDCIGCYLYHYCSEPRCKILNKMRMGEYCKSSPIECAIENIKYKINFS